MKNNSICIRNIYCMLAYAFQNLRRNDEKTIESEDFEHIDDLMAYILLKGLTQQIKQGLYRMYIPQQGNLSVLRGRLDMRGTMRNCICRNRKLSCFYDEMSENHIFNQILKTSALCLIRHSSARPERKSSLRRVLRSFQGIEEIPLSCVPWNGLSFHRNNGSYKMLIYICHCILDRQIFKNDSGSRKMMSFADDQRMCRLYEKFILEYYRYHYPDLHAAASQIAWNLNTQKAQDLPVMKTDVTLTKGGHVLIIDAKYYSHVWQTQPLYDSRTLHSGNLYQIFTYVKNKDCNHTGQVSGLLLYAKTGEDTAPDCDFQMDGSRISVKTLDLNQPFSEIKKQLNDIVERF